ncbi:Succinyl-CoA:(R)-benzylsuccinate CoA-transferase subunit BbsF [Methylibium sp. T29-B]|uniref:CaiB/BaiF CoA transferase family protein n=1 Tax=Methylibium sp. T29-B TaxID=1437443 RepID=UPI0003F44C83|nr:CaiB/BaiF CoA-transferase family protein [Methylibium sp. T29-B]EWS61924.1 Succinyl-CoA:(R)-benzylsuccinate CoA-transferase subunit BbsF [Methylibium sp. T29-B]
MQILEGIKVVELGQLIAGPFAAKTLADFGARVVKIEPPGGGDPLRKWRKLREGNSVWWDAQSRNKESVAIDLRQPEGQALVRELLADADVLIENFRPGTLEAWGLGWEALHALNPRLIMLRLSGFGQTGPRAGEPGFAAVGEAFAGLRHLNAEPGRAPVRAGVSLGDTVAGLHGAMGVLLALYGRDALGGTGQMIDLALYEAMFNLTESLLPEYDAFGEVRQPAGGALPGIAPSNAYPCGDGRFVLVAGNGDSIFRRLMAAIDRPDLADDPALARNDGRAARAAELDAAIGAWTAQRTLDDVLAAMAAADVPASRLYTIADLATDAHYQARGNIERIPALAGGTIAVPGIVPRLSATPGAVRRRAPRLGEHSDAVLHELGHDDVAIAALRARKIVG